jgi:hypothetical protein
VVQKREIVCYYLIQNQKKRYKGERLRFIVDYPLSEQSEEVVEEESDRSVCTPTSTNCRCSTSKQKIFP